MAKKLDDLSTDELLKYVKTRQKQEPGKSMDKIVAVVNSQSIEEKLEYFDIPIKCPKCGSVSKINYDKTTKGTQRYKCKDCGKTYTALTGTIFEGTSYTWDDMCYAIQQAVNFTPIKYTSENLNGNTLDTGKLTKKGKASKTNVHTHKTWNLRLKLYHLMSKQEMPKLNGIIECDEKYFREAQKGSRHLFSFVSKTDIRHPRKNCDASIAGIFGSEFVCVLSAVDRNKNYWAKCVSLGTPSYEILKKEFEPYVEGVQYICSDAYEIYEKWCDEKSYRHYVEPTQCKIERTGFGYVEVNNKHPEPLTDEEKAKNRSIAEEMFAERKWPHIRNSGDMDLDTMYLLKNKDNLHIETVNSFHNGLETALVGNRKSVSTKYLPYYVGAYTYIKNWQTKHGHYPTTLQDAQTILVELLKNGSKVSLKEIPDITSSLPRPSPKKIVDSRKKLKEVRKTVITDRHFNGDKSAYEGDSEFAPFVFDKRKFFSNLGAIRLNALAKQYGVYFKGQHKEDKVRKLCALSNANEIINHEIYLHSGHASEQEIKDARTKKPKGLQKKRGRPKKNKSIEK